MFELEILMNRVAKFYGISADDMKGRSRDFKFVRARFMFFYLVKARFKTKHPLKSIGLIVDRDHASVIHGVKTIERDIETNYKGALREYKSLHGANIDTNFKSTLKESAMKIRKYEKLIKREKNYIKSI